MQLKFTAAIFDLDGTLLDSMGLWTRINAVFFGRRSMVVEDDYSDIVKYMNMQEAARYTKDTYGLEETPEEIVDEWSREAVYEYANILKLKPGARDYLALLKSRGVKIALATASPEAFYEPALRANEVYEYFDAFCTTAEVGVTKEKPDIYRLAARKLGAEPKQCVVFEDVIEGLRSAGSLGMMTVGILDRNSAADHEPIKKIADLAVVDFTGLIEG